jgi:hypothetical protein
MGEIGTAHSRPVRVRGVIEISRIDETNPSHVMFRDFCAPDMQTKNPERNSCFLGVIFRDR